MTITRITTLLGFIFTISTAYSQPNRNAPQSVPGPIIVCPPGEFSGIHHVHTSREIRDRMNRKDAGEPCATINVTYTNFPANAQTAFQEAVNIWSHSISSSVDIQIDASWENLGSGVLGSAGPALLYNNFANAPADTYYPVALANQIAGFDLAPGQTDIQVNINSNFSWYFGTDGEAPFNQYDLVSVVLHELGHGLGFISTGQYDTGEGSIGIGASSHPLIYDEFLILGQNGTEVLDIAEGIPLGNAFTSNNLYCNSAGATAANDGVQPKLYAPTSFSSGSSLSHLDESTFPSSNENTLMTPQIGPGQTVHNPGGIALGLFENMGWVMCNADTTSQDTCSIESLIIEGETTLCPDDTVSINTATPPVIPVDGGLAIHFFSTTTAQEVIVPNISLPYSFDSGLNGFLNANGLDPLEGEYQAFAFIYTDSTDYTNSICAASPTVILFDFLTDDNALCTPDPCENDLIAPIAECQNISIWLDADGIALLTPAQVDNGSVDSCGIESMEVSKGSFICDDLGENNIILTVTDFEGNTSSCNALVTVLDSLSPTLSVPDDLIVNSDFLQCSASNVSPGTPIFNDNCSELTITNNAPDSFPLGETIIEWTVSDASGNETSDTQLVTVIENPENQVSVTASGDTTFCEGGEVTLSASPGFSSYLWSNGSTTQNITVSQSDVYTVTAEYGTNCEPSISDSVTVTVLPDTDNDGTCDFEDNCPEDPEKTEPGECGCGTPDTDTDTDGIADCNDPCPLLELPIGAPCDDGDNTTANDSITVDCECVGIPSLAEINSTLNWNPNCDSRPVHFKFYQSGSTSLSFEMDTLINPNGQFSLSNIPSGTYSIVVKVEGYLSVLLSDIVLSPGANTLPDFTILPGDINGDNTISLVDISILNTTFGLSATDENFQPYADINCDGQVTLIDVSFLNPNFGAQGETIID